MQWLSGGVPQANRHNSRQLQNRYQSGRRLFWVDSITLEANADGQAELCTVNWRHWPENHIYSFKRRSDLLTNCCIISTVFPCSLRPLWALGRSWRQCYKALRGWNLLTWIVPRRDSSRFWQFKSRIIEKRTCRSGHSWWSSIIAGNSGKFEKWSFEVHTVAWCRVQRRSEESTSHSSWLHLGSRVVAKSDTQTAGQVWVAKQVKDADPIKDIRVKRFNSLKLRWELA